MKKWQHCLMGIVGLLCLLTLSCRTFVDRVTPANLDEQVRILAEVDSNDFGILGPTLHDLKNIKNQLVIQHREQKLAHVRATKDLDFLYPFAFGILDFDIQDSEEWQQIVIGSEGNPISILGILAGLGLTGIGTAVGRKYLHTPGDLTPEQHQLLVNKEIGAAYEAGLQANSKKKK